MGRKGHAIGYAYIALWSIMRMARRMDSAQNFRIASAPMERLARLGETGVGYLLWGRIWHDTCMRQAAE